MKEFIIQYSYPNDNRIAVSDWIEKTTIVMAETLKEARHKFNQKHQHLGQWMILDAYPKQ
jgi:hypothetical protein